MLYNVFGGTLNPTVLLLLFTHADYRYAFCLAVCLTFLLILKTCSTKHNNNCFTAVRSRYTRVSRCSHKRRDLLEQPLDFYEPDVLPAAHPIVSLSEHYRKSQWFDRLLFYRHGISI